MKRLIVDMDGVLADVYSQFKIFAEMAGDAIPGEKELIGRKEGEAYPNVRKYVNTPGFFLNVPVMPGSVEVLEQLNDAYDLYIVSSAMEFPLSLYEKYVWLQKHFPFLTWQQLVLCGSKKIVSGDIMLDDHFKNLDFFEGQSVLYTQPHNALAGTGNYTRVHNWQEVKQLLL